MRLAVPKVLVSNNSALLRHLMAAPFRPLDLDLSVATTGEDAVSAAERESPALAILDAEMPGISGYDAATRIKAIAPGCKVMLVTDKRITATEMQRMNAAGCDKVLIAPMGADELYDVVAIQLELPRRGSEQLAIDMAQITADGERAMPGRVTNLSVDGARLISPEPLAEGTRLRLTITPHARRREATPLTVNARVVWSQPGDPETIAGASFEDLDEAAQARLARLTQWEIIQEPDRTRVVIKGDITEATNLEDLLPRMVGRVDFDLSQVRYMNSLGVREWVQFLKRANIQGYEMHACSVPFVLQASMISDVVGRGTIVSFFAPYFCEGCNEQTEKLLQSAAILAADQQAPLLTCSACNGQMRLDDIPERYLAFLEQ